MISAESTELFTGPPEEPLQLVRVTHSGGAAEVRVEGEGLTTPTAAIADAPPSLRSPRWSPCLLTSPPVRPTRAEAPVTQHDRIPTGNSDPVPRCPRR